MALIISYWPDARNKAAELEAVRNFAASLYRANARGI